MSLKEEISNILRIPNNDCWKIVESDGSVHLVHYQEGADLETYGFLRGVVVDTELKRVVCSSFGYAPYFVADSLSRDAQRRVDENAKVHDLDLSQARFRIGYEGTVLRVFKHRGKVYFSTHRRLDASRSRWGNTHTFTELYEQLGGPTAKELFDENKDSSPFVSVFLVSHPEVLMCSLVPSSTGFLVYLSCHKMFSEHPATQETVDWSFPSLPLVYGKRYLSLEGSEDRRILLSPYLSLEEANDFLARGFFPEEPQRDDKRLSKGEFVIAEIPCQEGSNSPDGDVKLVKFHSSAYEWRNKMRGKDSNLYHRFFLLATDSYGKKPLENYFEEYPLVPKFVPESEVRERVAEGPLVSWPTDASLRDNVLTFSKNPSKNCLLYNIWACFLLSVPISRQATVAEFLSSYRQDRMYLVQWLAKRYENGDELPDVPRMVTLLRTAEQDTRRDTSTHLLVEGEEEKTMQRNISRLVHREYGKSLYKMVTAAKRWDRLQQQEQ
jgi:hypothetical protein